MIRSITIAGVAAMVCVAGSYMGAIRSAAADGSLTITSWGGAYQDSQKKAFFEPYSKATGVKITEDEYSGEVAKIRAMVESNSVTWDVVDVDSPTEVQACSEGIIETIDWSKTGLDKSKFQNADKYDCGVPNILYSTTIAYDKDVLANGPTTIADLFDLQKFPGKRGLLKSPFINLEWALIADGVPAKDVYNVLKTKEGVDRAFKKLDTIKKDVVWWEAGAQPPQLLASKQVVMTSAYTDRITVAAKETKRNFVVVWDAEAVDMDFWVLPKGGPHADEAYKFINFASQPKVMEEQTRYIAYSPANSDANPLIDASILADLPTAPDHMEHAILVDAAFWGDRGEDLRNRFTAWLAQ